MQARIKAVGRIVLTWLAFAGLTALFDSSVGSRSEKRKKKENR